MKKILLILSLFLISFVSASFGYDNSEITIQTEGGITGDCPDGEWVQNITTGGVECAAPAGGGDITNVIAGSGLTGGGESGEVTLNVDATTCEANEISKYDGNSFNCVTDQTGGGGDGLIADGTYLYNDTTYMYFNSTLAGTNLSVNFSDYWDSYNDVNTTHFENVGGTLTIIHSWLTDFINSIINNFFDQDLNTTDDVTFRNITANNITADYFFGNGSQLTGLTLTESDPLWTGNQSNYFNTTDLLGFSYYNSTTIPSYILTSEEGNLDVNSSTWWGSYDSASDLNNLITLVEANITDLSHTKANTTTCSGTDKFSAYDNSTGTFTCTTDEAGGGGYDLNITSDSGSDVITDAEIFNFTGVSGISTSISGNVLTITGTGISDTNETGRFDNLTAVDCGGTDKVIGVQNNGTVLCGTDQTGAGGGLEADGTYLYNDTSYLYFNTTLADTNLSVNSSDYWDHLGTFNTTQFEEEGGLLHLLDSWLTTFFNSLFSGKSTDDLTQGSVNFYDNQSWNQTSVIGDFNVTNGVIKADYFFGNGSQLTDIITTEIDPFWTGNQSSYFNTTDILGFGYYNATDFDIDNYYLKSNPSEFYNSTTIPSYVENEVDPLWTANSTLIGYLAQNNQWTANQNLTNKNMTNVQCINFQNGASWCGI